MQVIRLIRCQEDEVWAEPDFDVYDIIGKVKEHLLARLRTSTLKPSKLKSPQNQIVNWLQGLGTRNGDLLEYFSEPLPDIYLRDLRSLWIVKGLSEEILLLKLREFKEGHPLQPEEEMIVKSPEEPELRLVCYLAITG